VSAVKGWCPGAWRPMKSGDGLIVRVRPHLARITAEQVIGLCDLSQRLGNGIIDLTSRANLQLRGIAEADHEAVLAELLTLNLLDVSPGIEARRNILTTPLWQAGDLTTRLHAALLARLAELPELPAKMGMALDTGTAPLLTGASADLRLEHGENDTLILRADGMSLGRAVTEATAIDAVLEMAHWFVANASDNTRRMARLVARTAPPDAWLDTAPRVNASRPRAGDVTPYATYGAPFGSINAGSLAKLVRDSGATALRCTPWRLFLLEDAAPCPDHGFVTDPQDPLLTAHACPGAPACAEATVDTRTLARSLAPRHPAGLHVSGCSKGCAYPRVAVTTLVGNAGTYDLVENGHPWDQPCQRDLTPADLLTPKA
jgi:precorrin-3B synthase